MQADGHPWRRSIADRVAAQVARGRAGQPLLLVGPPGCGKEATALEIARRLNCGGAAGGEIGCTCESCQKIATFQHPDVRWIGPAPASFEDANHAARVRDLFAEKMANPFFQPGFAATSQVLIGNPDHPGPLTVRGLMQFTRRQAFQGRWKVGIVADAHRLNTAAANAFLKTLEEPPQATLLLLVTSRPSSLLATILSRCQKVVFEPYSDERLAAIVAVLAPDTAVDDRTEAVHWASGDARRALALLEPQTRALRRWAGATFAAINEGTRGFGALVAEQMHAGILPQIGNEDGDGAISQAQDPATRRQRALVFCELLAMLTAETLSCRERAAAWKPRAEASAAVIRSVADRRRSATLRADLDSIERTKHEIDGNFNLGLVVAVLCEDLADHARQDHVATSA